MASGQAFACSELSKRYERKDALRGVSLEVGESQVVGLLGPDGLLAPAAFARRDL